MNVSYQVVWNSTTNSWVVASEFAKRRKKAGSGSAATATLMVASGTAFAGGLDVEALRATEGIAAGAYMQPVGESPAIATQDAQSPITAAFDGTTVSRGDAEEDRSAQAPVAPGIVAFAEVTPLSPATNVIQGQFAQVGNGYRNVAIGDYAGNGFVSSRPAGSNTNNVFIGADAARNGSGHTSVAIGGWAAQNAKNMDHNVALGSAAAMNSTGGHNTMLGAYAGAGLSGSGNIAIGFEANRDQVTSDSIAIGKFSRALGLGSIGLGESAWASGKSSLSVGYGANATGDQDIAIGVNAGNGFVAPAGIFTNNTLVGQNAGENGSGQSQAGLGGWALRNAEGNSNTGVGSAAGMDSKGNRNFFGGSYSGRWANGDDNTAVGADAMQRVAGSNNVAIGKNANKKGVETTLESTIAIGFSSQTGTREATAIGYSATADGLRSIALGSGAHAQAEDAISIGRNASSAFKNDIAIGAYAGAGFSPSTGQGSLSNVFMGNSAGSGGSGNGVTALGMSAMSQATNSLHSTAVGAHAGQQSSGALNFFGGTYAGSSAKGDGNIGIGHRAISNVSGSNNVAIGQRANEKGAAFALQDTIAIGNTASTGANNATAIGSRAQATSTSTIAVGEGAIASHANSLALGAGSSTAAHVATTSATIAGTTYNFAGNAPTSTVSFGAVGAERTLTNVAAGRVSATSTDAVNGSQLSATNKAVDAIDTRVEGVEANITTINGNITTINNNIATLGTDVDNLGTRVAAGFGGATAYDPATGTWTKPAFDSIRGKVSRDNVHDALKDVADGFTAVDGRIDTLADNAVQYDSASKDTVTLGGTSAATPVRLTNVANGGISATSTDAINGSQLHATNTRVTTIEGDVTTINNNIANIGTDVDNLGTQVAAGFGGAAAYDPATGAWTKPAFDSIRGKASRDNVHQALQDVEQGFKDHDTSITNNTDTINNIVNGALGLVQRDAATGALTVAAAHEVGSAASINFAGTDGAGNVVTRRLTGVSEGVADNDAVSVSQLRAAAGGGEANVDNLGEQVALAFGGATAYDKTTNTWIKPKFDSIRGNASRDNVHDALKDVADGFTAVDGRIDTLADNAVQYDSASKDTVTLGGTSASTPVRVTNLANGGISATSTDAINGSQLHATNTRVTTIEGDVTTINNNIANLGTDVDNLGTQVAAGFGGAAAYDPATGTWTKPAFDSIRGKASRDNVHQALQDVEQGFKDHDTSITNNTNTINNIVNGTLGLVQRDAATGALTVAAAHEVGSAASINFAGTDGAGNVVTRRLTGVSEGVADTDAVNMSQLRTAVVGGEANVDNLGEQVALAFGGATAYDKTTNTWIKPSFDSIRGKDPRDNVHEALQDVEGGFEAVDARIDTLADNAVQYDSATKDTVTLGGVSATSPVRMTNLANGGISATSTDAINGSQLHRATLDLANVLGGGAGVDAEGNLTQPTYVLGQKDDPFNTVGDAIENLDGRVIQNSTAISSITNQITEGSIGLVQQDKTDPNRKLTVGKDTDGTEVDFSNNTGTARVLTGIAAGEVRPTSTQAINGSQLHGTAKSVADVLGGSASVDESGKVKDVKFNIGGQDYYTVDSAFGAIQNGLNTGVVGLVRQDQTSRVITVAKETDGKAVSFKGTEGNRTLTDVAAGRLDATSTEAVNGSQLHATNTRVDQLETKVTEIDGRVANIEGDVHNIRNELESGNVGLVKQDEKSRVITVAADRDGTEVNMAGKSGTRKVTSVSDGNIAHNSKDAVNGGQVHALASNIADHIGGGAAVNPDGTISAPSYSVGGQSHHSVGGAISALDRRIDDWGYAMHGRIDDVERQAMKGTAAASALMVTTPYAPGKTAVNVGMAGYRGESALGVGISRWSDNGRWNWNAGVSAAKGDEAVLRVGVGILLGN